MNIISFTGHRPKMLPWGYNEKDKRCKIFKKRLSKMLDYFISQGYTTFITGMAQGFYMIAAELVIEKRLIHKIELHAYIPCENQEVKWRKAEEQRYNFVRSMADKEIVIDKYYNSDCMLKRNKAMVDNSNALLVLWNGQPSGTANTVKYAKDKDKVIYYINDVF